MRLGTTRALLVGLLLTCLAPSATASLPTPDLASDPIRSVPEHPSTADMGLKMRNAEGAKVIGQMVSDQAFWSDAWLKTYPDKVYDEMRLKSTATGYLPMITGEGLQDFDHEVVSHVIFNKMPQLPKYMSGAKAVVALGQGHDAAMGVDYSDTFWFLDMTVMYVVYPMRMYKRHDAATNTTYLWFEKIDATFVDAATWARYQAKMEETKAAQELRWAPFNSVNEVSTLYGIFIVSPGKTQSSRVTFVSKLAFGEEAGWVAKFGSELPTVLKSGLRSGFVASVDMVRLETEKRAKSGG